MRCVVILNEGAGGGDGAAARVAEALRSAGVDADVQVVAGRACASLARRAAADPAVDAVVAAGGDGTVSAVAGALANGDKPLGILPLGTLNHFARDLGIPADLDEAARLLARGEVRRVDVADVNGRVFVNNSSIGLYPQAVRRRAGAKPLLGKWIAMVWASLAVLLRFRRVPLRIVRGGTAERRRTALVFVGNNRYDTALLASQRRAALDRGELGVYVTRARSRRGILALALRALFGRLDAARDLEALAVPQLSILSHRRALHVAADGEVLRLSPPLTYRIHPGALRVLAPATSG